MSDVRSFDDFINSANVGAIVLLRATVEQRTGRCVRIGIRADNKLLTTLDVEATADPIPSDVVAAFGKWETDSNARAIVETYVWDHLLNAEFTRKMRNLTIELERVYTRDGTFRTIIRLMRGTTQVRRFEFVVDNVMNRTFVRAC